MKPSIIEVQGTDNYQAGGFEVTVGELRVVEFAVAQAQDAPYVAQAKPEPGTNKIKILVKKANTSTGDLEEVADGTDLSSYKFTVIAFGE